MAGAVGMAVLVGVSDLAGVMAVDFMAVTLVGDGVDTTLDGVTLVGDGEVTLVGAIQVMDIQDMDTMVVDMHHIAPQEEEVIILEVTVGRNLVDVALTIVLQTLGDDEVPTPQIIAPEILLAEIVAQGEALLDHKTEQHQNTILREEAVQ